MRFLLPRMIGPLLLLALIEFLFRLGVWEPMAARDSHSGTSIRAKHAVMAWADDIDYITLGSSRAEYGFDHSLLFNHAKTRGYTHLNLSQPGSHWLTITTISQWLQQRHPELKGGVIGLSYLDFQYPRNGSYELAIAQPFRPLLSRPALYQFQFDPNDLSSYGAWSALFAYRQDVRDFLGNPKKRLITNQWFAANKPYRFDENPETNRDVCALPWDSLEQCLNAAPTTSEGEVFQNNCRTFAPTGGRVDWSNLTEPLAPDRAETRAAIQAAIRGLGWPEPPIIVLLPTTHHWRDSITALGGSRWAHQVLDPLAASGEIVLIDRTEFFDVNQKTRCDVFIDLHHQNGVGATALTENLLPELDRLLYQR